MLYYGVTSGYVVNGSECGSNAIGFIICNCCTGDLYLYKDMIVFKNKKLCNSRTDVVIEGSRYINGDSAIEAFNRRSGYDGGEVDW